MMKKHIFLLMFFLKMLPANAQNIEIDADQKLEWYRNEQKMIAIGNAVAQKNGNILKGDTITAFYERVQLEDGSQKTQIQKILANDNVSLEMNNSTGYGTHFEYDLPKKTAVLYGKPAKLINQQGEITATQNMTYYLNENKSIALGKVIAKNPEYTVYANKMISYFKEVGGKKELEHIEIFSGTDPVKLVNNQGTVVGKRGTYFPVENKLRIYDNVVIHQEDNILNGDYAETDLNTGISRVLPAKKQGRVTGVFHNKKKEEK